MTEIPYKVCKTREAAEEYLAGELERLAHWGLIESYGAHVGPLSHTRDGYANPHGPWGVFLDRKDDAL